MSRAALPTVVSFHVLALFACELREAPLPLPPVSGDPAEVVETDVAGAPITTDGAHVYYQRNTTEGMTIHRRPVAGGAEERVTAGAFHVGIESPLLVLDGSVWFVAPEEELGQAYALFRVPAGGGDIERVAAFGQSYWLQTDGVSLFAYMHPIDDGPDVYRFTPGDDAPTGPLRASYGTVVTPEGLFIAGRDPGVIAFRSAASGPDDAPVLRVRGLDIVDFVVGPDTILYRTEYKSGFGLGQGPRTGGLGRSFVVTGDLPVPPDALWYSDGRTAAWFVVSADDDGGAGLLRVDLATAAFSLVFTGPGARFFALAGDHLWFVDTAYQLARVRR